MQSAEVWAVTRDEVVNPWDVVDALLLDSNAASQLAHQVVVSVSPLELRPLSKVAPQTAEAVLELLFQEPGQTASAWHVYALLDAGRSRFLPDRLGASGLRHCCIYDLEKNPELAETAPWLVELEPGAAFTRATLAKDVTSPDPRKMLGDGIFLAGALGLDEMRRHLKRYTMLKDELGVRQFFRLQEPGMMDALLCAANDQQRADFFTGIARMVYPRPALDAGKWDFVSVSLRNPVPARGSEIPRVDSAARKALAIFVNDRQARLLAVSDIPNQAERAAASWVFARLMNAGFDHPPRLVEAFRLLQKCPPDGYASFWRHVESGQHSLRSILLAYADHYCIEGVLESVW